MNLENQIINRRRVSCFFEIHFCAGLTLCLVLSLVKLTQPAIIEAIWEQLEGEEKRYSSSSTDINSHKSELRYY
jgi:hypothetical protein